MLVRSAGQRLRQISDNVGHHGHGRDALVELALVKFVDRIGVGVVVPKIFFAIDFEMHHRDAAAHQLEDIRSPAAFVDFARTELQQWSEGTFDDPRLELVIGDAKGFLEKDDRAYDVIIMDIADPIEAGPGIALYCQEFYQFLMKSGRLAPGGFFVTQSGPGSFINVDECGSTIHKTLRSAFNNVACFHADIPSFGSNWGFNMAFGGPADLESFDKDVLSKINKDTKFLLSKSIDDIDKQIEERINGTLKFYDGVTHRGLFGIPRDMRIFLSKEERYMTLENPVFMH